MTAGATGSGFEVKNLSGTKAIRVRGHCPPRRKTTVGERFGWWYQNAIGSRKGTVHPNNRHSGSPPHARRGKNFYFAARKKEALCLCFLTRVTITQAVKVFEGVLGGTFSKKSPLKTASP